MCPLTLPTRSNDWRLYFLKPEYRVLLTQQKLVAELSANGASIVCLDTDKQIIAQQSQQNPLSPITANSLAYVLYTSGSTGRPKGVTIAHYSTVSLIAWAKTSLFTTAVSWSFSCHLNLL